MKPFLVLLVSVTLAPTLHAQSLAEAAKAATKNSYALSQPAKVYTNKDLKDALPAAITVAPTPTANPAPATAQVQSEETARADAYRVGAKKDEAYWKGRRRDLQTALEADTIHLAAMISRVASLSADFKNSPSIVLGRVKLQRRK